MLTAEAQSLEDRTTTKSDVLRDLTEGARSKLTQDQLQLIQELSDFRAPYVREKLGIEKKISSDIEFMEAFTEFKKYVVLAMLNPATRMEMPSRIVDEVWHQFILFTKEYHEFCNRFLGHYMHHSPKTSFTPGQPEDKENFSREYRAIFGNLPEIWQLDYSNPSCWSSDDCVTCCRT